VGVVVLALAWLPGQSHDGAVREWLVRAVLPLVAARLVPRVERHLLPWVVPLALLAALDLLRGSPATFLVHAGWAAALVVGLAWDRGGDPGLSVAGKDAPGQHLGPPLLVAGGLAALPVLLDRDGLFGNTDRLAGFLCCTLLLSLGGWRRSENPWWRALACGSVAAQGAALAWCQSLGATAAFLLALWLTWRARSPSMTRWSSWITWGLPPAVAAMLGGFSWARDHLLARAHLWGRSVEVAGAHLPWGVGPGRFHAAFLEAQASFLALVPAQAGAWTNAAHAHSEPLHLLAEHGLAGVLLVAPLLGAALLAPGRGAAWGVVVAVTVHGLASLPLDEPATSSLAWLCVGLQLRRARPPATPVHRVAPARAAPALALALATTCAILGTSDLLADRLLVRGARTSSPSLLGWSSVLATAPTRAMQYQADRLLPEDPRGALDVALAAVARDPSPAGWVLVGRASMALQDWPGAVHAFSEAVRLHPRLFAGHVNLSLAADAAGDPVLARRHAARARALRPTDPALRRLPR
jgi:hypothetical protein